MLYRVVSAVLGWTRTRQLSAAAGVMLLAAGLAVVLTHTATRTPVALPPTPPSPTGSSRTAPPPVAASGTNSSRHPRPSASKTAQKRFRCGGGTSEAGVGTGAIHICIPAIDVSAGMITTGLNADRTIQVPTLAQVALASWYKYSPAPGVVGPSIILGHVDSAQYGKGVFYDLGRLRSGDKVSIERADAMVATYRITKVAEYPKSSFPTGLVYGNTPDPTVRLITCGGAFDPSAGSYEDNIVAFGSLLSLRKA